MKQEPQKLVPIGRQRIEKRLDKFDGLIDLSDLSGRPKDQLRQCFLSRALAAYCVFVLGEVSAEVAAKSVTDGFHDRGLDAIYYNPAVPRLIMVQSKWKDGIGWTECGEFCDGVRKLVSDDWDAFKQNSKIFDRQNELKTALLSPDLKIAIVTAALGAQLADKQSLARVDELVADELNGGADIAEAIHWCQKDLLDAITNESKPATINADLYLSDWGEVREPYPAVYGRVQAQAIVDLWKTKTHLSHNNLRKYFNRSDVNSAIAQTVKDEPSHFWYFNNGLTIVCNSFNPAPLGRPKREQGLYHFDDMHLVNGAQTTGILADHLETIPEEERDKLWIQVRFIATKGCAPGFESRITKYTNLQNAVTFQDFVALDPVQSRLACDFAVENRRYVFKRGERDPANGCTLREATIALACADPDVWFAVQVKREIGVLWQSDTERYKQLFHENLSAGKVWNAVCVMREVDESLQRMARTSGHIKAPAVASHLQRIVLHVVFRSERLNGWAERNDASSLVNAAGEVSHDAFRRICEHVAANHDREYIASLSKNFAKCSQMVMDLTGVSQLQLFTK